MIGRSQEVGGVLMEFSKPFVSALVYLKDAGGLCISFAGGIGPGRSDAIKQQYCTVYRTYLLLHRATVLGAVCFIVHGAIRSSSGSYSIRSMELQ